jgi:peptidoglycan hydrolase CwlO-like protein
VWSKIKSWFKKYWHIVVAGVVFLGGFIVGRRTVGDSGDFDQLRADNTKLRQQIESFRAEYERLVNLNRLNEQQLNDLARQLEIAGKIARQSESIDSGNADDIERLRQTNQRLADWILENGTKIQPDENSGN